jgi:hypothetical protein
MKTLLPFVIVISMALGYALGANTGEKIPPPPPLTPPVDASTRSLQTLIDHDYVDYLRLQKLEDQYKKSDEILGKIMQIFLADLSLRFTPEIKTAILAKNNPAAAAKTPPKNPLALPSPTPAFVIARSAGPANPFVTIDDPTQVESFLKTMTADDVRKIWVQNEFLKKEPVHLSGCFEGIGQVTNPTDTWVIRMLHQFSKGADGESLITISSNGKVDSRSSGKGNNGHLRGIDNQPDALLLEASPDTIFQMFFISGNETWVGTIYRKDKKGDEYKPTGTFELKRGTHCGS